MDNNDYDLNVDDITEQEIRKHAFSILRLLKREDVVQAILKAIPEMEKDNCTNGYKIRDYCGTLFDVTRRSL